jgi:zinc-ribbon domain
MIVTCPSCETSYRLPSGSAAGTMSMTCRGCGHRWKEMDLIEAIEIVDTKSRNLPSIIEHEEAPELEARRLANLAREAEERFAAGRAAKQRRTRNWLFFGGFAVVPFVVAALLPETVVGAVPISFKAYQAMGYDVNIYGLDIRRVERQHAIVDGKRILTLKGDISNISTDTRRIPWLRFALTDKSGSELYSWTLDTGARPLRSGETTGFVTRVQAPPEAAQNIKIRFAKASEIGSNPQDEQPVVQPPIAQK